MESSTSSNQLCIQNCGFFGNPAFNGMCSKCFKENEKVNAQKPVSESSLSPTEVKDKTVAAAPVSPPPSQTSTLDVTPAVVAEAEAESKDDMPHKKEQLNKNRCFMCNTKLTLAKQIAGKCRCDYIFCDAHRTPARHECTYDHQALNKGLLEKRLEKVSSGKGGSFVKLQ